MAAVGHPADDGEIEFPFLEDGARRVLALGLEHHQHPFLAFRQHDLVGRHAGLAARHPVEVELDPDLALRCHLDRRRGQPGGAHVLDRDDGVGRHQLEAGFEQQLLGERVADLDRRPLGLGIVGEFGRGHGRAVDTVASGLGGDIGGRVGDPGGG